MKNGNTNKYIGIAKMLEGRVNRGDYSLRKLPSESELATETSVSRMTARKALKFLIDKGVLVRRRYGRLEVANESRHGRSIPRIAFLMPPEISLDFQSWQLAAEKAVEETNGVLRTVIFADWNDVHFSDVLNGFDGVFLMQPGMDVPKHTIEILKSSACPVVSLDVDLSAYGIPSIWSFPKASIWNLLDHLKELGHTQIACFNICEMNVVFQSRIDYWREWKEANGVEGDLFNFYNEEAGIEKGAEYAKKEFARMLDANAFRDTAMLCTCVWSSLGVEKAMDERGLQIGRAISVCAINDEKLGPWLRPSLTALRMADMESLLRKCVQWMTSEGGDWKGSKLLEPAHVPLYIGDSTGRPIPMPSAARASAPL